MKKHLLLLAALSLFSLNTFATLQTVTVQDHFFSPSTFNINLGDTVKWVWVNGSHTTTSLTIPTGATAWDHNINSSSTSFTYIPNKVGTYNYKCTPHFSMGMVASFVVACPTPTITITNSNPVTICLAGTVQLNSSASGGGPFTYQWQSSTNGTNWSNINGATNANYTTSPATASVQYRVIVTNACQNSATSSAVTVTPQILSIGVTPFQSSVCAGSCTSLTAALTNGGTIAGTYAWSPSAGLNSTTGATVTACPTGATTYTVVFTSTAGCTASSNAFVGVNALPVITATAADYSICSGTTTQLNATSNGSATISYSWSPTAGLSNPSISNPAAAPTVTTTYTVTGTNSNGCTGSDTVVIIVGTPFQLTQTHINATCGNSNGSIDLTVTGGGGSWFYYLWSNGATTQDLTNIPSANYSVTVTSTGGCSNILTVAVGTSNGPTLSVTHVDAICGNATGSINLSVSGGTAPYTYLWSNSATTQDIANLSAGTYIVTVTDFNGCTSAIYAVVANTGGNIALTETHTNASCGNANGGINLSVTGGTAPYTYLWTNGATTQDQTGLAAGTYGVVVTDASGCTSSLGVSITNSSSITLTQAHGNPSCGNPNGYINLTVSPAGNYNYYWSNGATTEDITGLYAGTYTVTVYSSGTGCYATLSVTLNNANSGTLTQTHVDATCGNANGSINLSVSPNGNYNYIWTNGATTQDLNNIPSGTYSVTVSSSAGCSNSLTVTVNGTTPPVVTAQATNASCGANNGSVVSAVAYGVPPYTYSWSNGATTANIQGLAPGVYSVTVYDQNQCSGSYTVTVGQSGAPTPVVSIQSGSATFCAGGSAVLAVSPAGSAYQWKKNGTNLAGATNSTYTATVSGTFTCAVAYSCGTAVSNGVVITKLATPTATITANGPTTFCAGQSVMLSVNVQAGVTYQWRKNGASISGATNTTYTATTSGNYRCYVVKTATGCNKLSNIITVTVNCRLEDAAGNTFKYYPNPFNTELTVQLNASSTVTVYNVLGQKKIELKDVNGEIKLGQDLLSGIYILEVRENGRVISSQRIVKVE